MRRVWILMLSCVLLLQLPACAQEPRELPDVSLPEPQGETIDLLRGEDLSGWKLFLPDEDADPAETWQVKDGIVQCTGEPAGYMRTLETYRDYVLTFEWRWPAGGGNSGVLVHIQEEDEVWPKSIEGQLQNQSAGDFWVIGGTDFNEREGVIGRRLIKAKPSSEKPQGDWNHYTVEAKDDTIILTINGTVQNIATGASLTEGYIGLQSEGTPIEFRNITLQRYE